MNHRLNTCKCEHIVHKICVSILFNDNYTAKEKAICLHCIACKFTILIVFVHMYNKKTMLINNQKEARSQMNVKKGTLSAI